MEKLIFFKMDLKYIFEHIISFRLIPKYYLCSKNSMIYNQICVFFGQMTTFVHHFSTGFGIAIYTLQAHVRFNIFEFSQMLIFFILTLSTHVSGFTLHTVIKFFFYIV